MSNDTVKKLAELEALLFIHGEPLTLEKIAKTLGVSKEDAAALVAEYSSRLALEDRGLALISQGEKVQLVTKPALGGVLGTFVKGELSEELSPASLEALAIVSYFGPISRTQVDYERGVNSSFILRSLLLRGLAERSPDPARPNSYLYAPSFELLKHLGVTKREDLPEYERFKALFEKMNPPLTSDQNTLGTIQDHAG